ncbi:MAG TPA: sugar ABC transporter ATP-binding protein [Candidatus Angelobacter sp.]|nr:sugar ABC transporter ATP-binding protein [Candidatus Angelobacter sp.]
MTPAAANRDSATDPALVAARKITKLFPGVRALEDVDFTLRRGEIHALMGENGAGKSTLIKVLTGVYRPDCGEILLEGRSIDPRSPAEAQTLGISTVYQEVNLVPLLSVAENIFLGRQPMRLGRIDWRQINLRAKEVLGRLDVNVDVTRPLNSYSIAIQQMAAIARALDLNARVLVLDEPTSSLDANEVGHLFEVLRRLKSRGLGIIFVSHFLDQVYAISDRMTVLRNGRWVGEFQTSKLPRLELIAKMIGKDLSSVEEMSARREGKTVAADQTPFLEVKGLARRGSMRPFDLEIRAGEVVGLAGLLGSGRTETARLLFGVDRADAGEIRIDGRAVVMNSPRAAIARRFGFCPEDRKAEAIIPDLSVRENITLALQASKGWFRRMPSRQQQALATNYIKVLNIATSDAEKPVRLLSGGNQQKVILARWLASEPRLLILDEPTRGIDVGAKAEIEKLIARLCADGMAILFISSELEEVARDSHRVVVLRDRTKIGELQGEQVDLSAIMRVIAGDEPKRR